MSATDDIAEVKLAGYFIEWDAIEDAKAKLAERSKDLGKAMKDEGFNTKAARTSFREQRADLNATQDDIAKAEEEEKVIDLYRAALKKGLASRAHPAPAHEKTLRNSGSKATSYAEAKGVETNTPATANVTPGADIRAAGRGVHSMHPLQDQPETANETNPSDGSVNPHGEPVAVAANMENGHVDSSAERASSAVEFGATNSPERANEFSDWHSRQAEPGANASKGVTGGESAATNSHSLPTSSQVADTADSVTPPALPAPITAGPQSTAVPGGEPSTPSLDAGGAKMDEVGASPDRSDDKSVIHHAQSKQAAPNSDDTPAFLKSKEGCQRPGDCSIKFQTDALCYRCANDRALGMVTA